MKNIIVFIPLVVFSFTLHSQQIRVNVEYDKKIDHPFFHTTDSVYNPMTLVFKDEAGRLHYDNIPDSNKYATQANIIFNKDEGRQLRFGEYRRGDAVDFLKLNESGPSESLALEIAVEGSSAYVSFSSSTPILGTAVVKLTSVKLVLNTMYPQKGDLLKGKVSFKAVCEEKCGYKTYEGEGYFKCIVQ